MSRPEPQGVIIGCPHCGTRYQLAPEALGKGRLVQCANCKKSWQASALPLQAAAPKHPGLKPGADEDEMFDPAAEAELDATFAAEQQTAAAEQQAAAIAEAVAPGLDAGQFEALDPEPEAPPETPIDPKVQVKRQRAFSKRQRSLNRRLPIGRLRRALRMAGLVALMVVVGVGIVFRTEVVKQVPDLAGVYEMVGLGVNVIGLEFRDVRTIRALRDGTEVMTVDARIVSVSGRNVVVPPVVVTLLDTAGSPVYEWSVTPDVRDLEPGEYIEFETTLTAAPQSAERVRLTFTNGRSESETPIAVAASEPEVAAEPEPEPEAELQAETAH
jgi:predicted Zn finger-like uncharacterized protein